MKKIILSLRVPALFISLSAFSLGAFAHGDEDHSEEAKPLDCSAMAQMDHAKVDASDVVMQAMMMKCEQQMNAANNSSEAHGHSDSNAHGESQTTAAHSHDGAAADQH